MAIPLPRVVYDVERGGPLITAMRGAQDLQSDIYNNQIRASQAQYAPLTTQANAISKLAYANLMGPQFLAKAMHDPGFMASVPEDQKQALVNLVYNAGTGQGMANALLHPESQQKNIGPVQKVVNSVKNAFGFNQNIPQDQQQPNVYQNLSQRDLIALANQKPGEAVSIQGSQIPYQQQFIERSPEQMNAPAQTYAEKTGEYLGNIAQGRKSGEMRAQSINDLDTQYQQALQAEVPINHLIDISQSPIFMNMRNQIPFFQDKQLNVLSKIGTPEQQRIIGDFITTTTNAVANTVNGFRGRILDKEISMANQMKISPNDTWNTMIGKLGSIETFNQMIKQRSRLASQLMEQKHLNKGDALEQADKRIDANQIRKDVDTKLNPKPTYEDIQYMAKKYNVKTDEIIKRLKDRGKL